MRAVVNVATGRYVRGQERLTEWLAQHNEEYFNWRDRLPDGSPSHQDVPYAFKAYALREAIAAGARTLLWADACILPAYPLKPLWERIERDGYWIGSQAGPEPYRGYTNYEWTADSAYPDLFALEIESLSKPFLSRHNRTIPHVVATTFGISMDHRMGKAIFEEYFRLASETKAFCGPWLNRNHVATEDFKFSDQWMPGERECVCGPPDVRGHRHDQTALSVIAWRLDCELTRWPNIFAYRGHETEQTILVADGNYK